MKIHFFIYILLLLLPALTKAQTYLISTVAGNGTFAYLADSVPATSTGVGGSLVGLVFDHLGNYYFALSSAGGSGNGNRIRKITPSGIIQTIAGTGTDGYTGDGGQALNATLNGPTYITIDKNDNIYFSDYGNCVIRRIDKITGIISTIAGNGTPGNIGDGGPATAAELHYPAGICFDTIGNLYVADADNFRIRMIDTFGVIHPYAGSGVNEFTGVGGLADTSSISTPFDLCMDTANNLFFSIPARVCKINATTGYVSLVAGNGTDGNTGDGGFADTASLGIMEHMAFNSQGELFLSDATGLSVVRKIDNLGIIHNVAGTGVEGYNGNRIQADTAKLNEPRGIAFDSCGNLYICDNGNARIRKVTFDTSCVPASTLKVNQIIGGSGVAIYPNPAYDELTITANNKIKEVTVCNVVGEVVYSEAYDIEKAEVNVAGLPPGVYVVRVTNGDGNVVVRNVVKSEP